MKFFLAIALIATVASAAYIKPAALTGEAAEIQEILAAIHSPSTNPATAAALEQMLLDILGIEPVIVGPAIIDTPVYEPVSVGPAIIDTPVYEPVSVGPAIIDFPVPAPSPVLIEEGPVAEASAVAPLVQIILNINQAAGESPVAVAPVVVPEPADVIDPVQIVDNWPVVSPVSPVQVVDNVPVSPVQVVDNVPVSPVQVVDNVPVSPVQVVDAAPVAPVIIGTPVLPSPAAILPEDLN